MTLGKVLVIDDDEIFLRGTAERLRKEGYECEGTIRPDAALGMIEKGSYDSVIAELRLMDCLEPGFFNSLPSPLNQTPLILVTCHPTPLTKIKSVHSPVAAYLVKPVDSERLLKEVASSTKRFRFLKTLQNIRENMERWREDLEGIGCGMKENSQSGTSVDFDTFINLTCQNISRSMSNLEYVTGPLDQNQISKQVCHLFHCPRLTVLKQTLRETVEVLRQTKASFRSKEIAQLRKKLEDVAKEMEF